MTKKESSGRKSEKSRHKPSDSYKVCVKAIKAVRRVKQTTLDNWRLKLKVCKKIWRLEMNVRRRYSNTSKL